MLRDRGTALTGLGVGVGLMYFLDPERGRRRRALVKDKLTHTAHLGVDAMGATGRDLSHRTAGAVARVRGALDRRPVDDVVLVQRMRAQLGRVVTHPHAIAVDATAGRVRLRGPILRQEVDRLIRAAHRVRGVRDIVNELEVHARPDGIPALQGGGAPAASGPAIPQLRWAPATRIMVGTSATALLGYGASRRDIPGALLAASGLGLLARAVTNLAARRALYLS